MKTALLTLAIGAALLALRTEQTDPRPMKAYKLNDQEVWAAHSAEGAIAIAIEETGEAETYQLEEARELTDEELDTPIPFDEITTETTTLREELAGMTEPGLLASSWL